MASMQMHPNEIPSDAALVSKLIASQFPEWRYLQIRHVPSSGTDNAMYRLGEHLAVRLPRIHWAVDAVDREQHWLPLLRPLLPVAIPVPIAKGKPTAGFPYPWSVYEWLPGSNLAADSITDLDMVVAELANFIGALQNIPRDGAPAASRSGQLCERSEPVQQAIDALTDCFDPGALQKAWQASLKAPAWKGEPVWTHADLAPGNLLFQNGRLTAVIDFSGVGLSDPAVDLIIAWNFLPPPAREQFRAAMNVDDSTWMRGRGWALSVALIQLPYYRGTNPPLAANARHVIAEVLNDAKSSGS